MIVQFRNEKISNHGSIPISIDCNVVAFIVFEEGFHQPIKRTKQSVFLDVTVFRHTLVISFTPNAAVLFVDVAIQPEVRFIAKQNSLMKIGNNGNLVLGPFDESTPCLMIVLMNCQTKLRINPLTAVKSVAILENHRDKEEGMMDCISQTGVEFRRNAVQVFVSEGQEGRIPTENSLAVLNHKILEANSQVQNVKLGGHPTCLSINRLWHELCDMLRRLVGTTAPGHHDCSIQE
ncbi:uncharacterized protein TNCV_4350821 [Trichonephila clavipes]|nr:uncharacterized protein TNCV_4350821 [Trichonephila clavipes]